MTACHLHSVIQQLEHGDFYWPKDNDEHAAEIVHQLNQLPKPMASAVCFDIGDDLDLNGLRLIPGLLKLPFPLCWFEFTRRRKSSAYRYGVIAEELDGVISTCILVFNPFVNAWQFIACTGLLERRESTGLWKIWPEPVSNKHGNDIIQVMRIMWAFLSALNCSNVHRIEHLPPERLQKARAKRGKKPLFSFWTLHLDFDRNAGAVNAGAGTHASPRLHLRRGHARQYAPGKYTWVRDCAVGTKDIGVVNKDYAVKLNGS